MKCFIGENLIEDDELAKESIMKFLKKQGYVTYSYILEDTNFKLTKDPEHIGYMNVNTGDITINSGLTDKGASFVVRHEICHSFLQHEKRLLKQLAKHLDLDYEDLSSMSLNSLQQWLHKDLLQNIVADFDISNQAYTEADKELAKELEVNGKISQCLVTELDHPGWENLSLEEMFEAALEERKDDENELLKQLKDKDKDKENPNQQEQPDVPGNPDSGLQPIVVKGTFKDGQFYKLNGTPVKH